MNKSYSKIRHMQQSNILLEQRRVGLMEQKDWNTISDQILNTVGGNGLPTDENKLMFILKTNVKTKQDLNSLQQAYNSKGENFTEDINSLRGISSQYTTWVNTLK